MEQVYDRTSGDGNIQGMVRTRLYQKVEDDEYPNATKTLNSLTISLRAISPHESLTAKLTANTIDTMRKNVTSIDITRHIQAQIGRYETPVEGLNRVVGSNPTSSAKYTGLRNLNTEEGEYKIYSKRDEKTGYSRF